MYQGELIATIVKEANITPRAAEKALDALVNFLGNPLVVEGENEVEEQAIEKACKRLAQEMNQIHEQVKAMLQDYERHRLKVAKLKQEISKYGL